jgi:hypothetical protein
MTEVCGTLLPPHACPSPSHTAAAAGQAKRPSHSQNSRIRQYVSGEAATQALESVLEAAQQGDAEGIAAKVHALLEVPALLLVGAASSSGYRHSVRCSGGLWG